MLRTLSLALTVAVAASTAAQTTVAKPPPPGDPFIWLEQQTGARAMAWVKRQNARTLPILQGDPHFKKFYADELKIVNAKDRVPFPDLLGGMVYNFWQSPSHVRGIWRRTTVADYASKAPHWETVLDMDAVAKAAGKNWFYRGADCNEPVERYCMVDLSDGGEDAVTEREFDTKTKTFVPNGFTLPRAKQNSAWVDNDTLLVARPWTPGEVTASGYAYDVRILKRGQPLGKAKPLYKGQKSDISVQPFTLVDGDGHRMTLLQRGVTFFTSEYYLVTPNDGLKKLALPQKLNIDGMVDGKIILTLNQNWTTGGKTIPQGSLIAIGASAAAAKPDALAPTVIWTPGPRDSVGNVGMTKNAVIVTSYHNVRGRATIFSPKSDGTWASTPISLPDNSSISVQAASLHGTLAYLTVTGFLTPTTVWNVDTATGAAKVEKASPARFDASKDVVEQHEAVSKDGTKIPYFIVHPKNMKYDGLNPTVINAYGGFQISMTPFYSPAIGKLWLEHGGVFVLANIRGGGEFGPAWHEAGLKTHRQRIYDDFYAVAQDVIHRKVTTPRHLGIMGGSNGGLLMGVEFTQHPSEYNAVDIEVPLLDMLRYEKIDAGASWVGEYGSVKNPKERAFLAKISPYNNLRGGVAYPEPFLWTTTKDDRVGPQHARKFAAKLAYMHVPYLFYEVTEGGHGSGANLKEEAHTSALEWTYFAMKLME